MKIDMQDGLPIVSVSLTFKGNTMCLNDVLLDTGCSTTIFDTDEVEEIGLIIDRTNGSPEECMELAEKVNFVLSKPFWI